LEFIRIARYDLECAQWTFFDAGTAAVTVFFRDEEHLIVCNPERTFHAGLYAFPAAIALLIDMDNFSLYFQGYFLSSWYQLRHICLYCIFPFFKKNFTKTCTSP
jgi:hypothetical protein